MWGWTGRNTPVSLAALRAPTVSDRQHELSVLMRMALKVGNDGLNHPNMKKNQTQVDIMSDQALRDLASERLADYKVMADQDMYKGFEAFLTGELGKATESSYVPVPYVHDSTRHLWKQPKAVKEVLEDVQTTCIPWGNNHLLHIPGAHGYLEGEYRKSKAFDIYIGSLYAMGPQTMDQAWHYYKFIVKQQRPTDRDIEEPGDAAAAAHVPASEQTADGAASGLEAEWTNKAAKGEVKKKRMPMLNSDKYEEVNIPRLAEWDPSTTKLDGTVVAIGKRPTGKSFAFRHILHSLAEHFPAGICISQTDELNKYWRQYMPSKYIFSKFEPEILHAIFDRQKSILNDPRLTEEEREKKARFFIILDDVISMLPPLAIGILLVGVIVLSLAACALLVASSYYLVLLIAFHNDKRIRYDAAIAELFVAGRHYKLFTMITTQYAKAITPTLKSNADYVLILHNKQEGQREALWRDFADFMTKEAFYTLMDAYTQDNEVLIVDTSDSTAKPWEVLKWFKASDPGEFLLGDEEYWSSLNSSNTVPAQNFDLPIDSMQLTPTAAPVGPTADGLEFGSPRLCDLTMIGAAPLRLYM
ncbi:hypothetical protein T492DRAFT_873122 [Pavlovales sp. CCMP2436]|nr:hypothetical protein T492DRAFT_873122 [Pavlovales sp. CCMP2436]